jgi:MOSC domain-containing protein YiiM
MTAGSVHSINLSRGGLPKHPQSSAMMRTAGLEGDRQNDPRHHGGPERAITLYSLELIHALQAEGHPIVPGSIGENLTLAAVDWAVMVASVEIEVGDALLEVTRAASPCEKIAGSFLRNNFLRVSEKLHPGWSRWCARVLREGVVTVGDKVVLRTARSRC